MKELSPQVRRELQELFVANTSMGLEPLLKFEGGRFVVPEEASPREVLALLLTALKYGPPQET